MGQRIPFLLTTLFGYLGITSLTSTYTLKGLVPWFSYSVGGSWRDLDGAAGQKQVDQNFEVLLNYL